MRVLYFLLPNDSLFSSAYWIISPSGVAVNGSQRGNQPAESDFYSKPLKAQQVRLPGSAALIYHLITSVDYSA